LSIATNLFAQVNGHPAWGKECGVDQTHIGAAEKQGGTCEGGAGGMDGKQLCRTDVDLRRGYMKVNKSIEEGQLAAKAREEALRKKEAMEENARMKREKRLD
jgi:hypothetical protein